MEDDFDNILVQLGTGKWNMLFFTTMCFWYAQLPYHVIGGVFLAPSMDHTCRPPPHAHTPTIVLPSDAAHNPDNISYTEHDALPQRTVDDYKCHFLTEDTNTGLLVEEPCTEWDFDNTTFHSTVTSEFQLVCDKKYLRATYQSMYMFGMFVGSCFSGYLGDRFGRYTVLVVASLTYCVLSIGSAWLPTLPLMFSARFLLGSMHPPSLLCGYILVQETIEPKMRAATGIVQFISWSIATMLYSGWAYLIRDWRWLQTAVSLPSLLMIPLLFTICESPRWLAVVGQHERALKELKKAAAWNKTTLPPDQELLAIMQKVQEQAVKVKKDDSSETLLGKLKSLLDQVLILFSGPKIRLITFIGCLVLFVVAMLFFGLTMGASALGVDVFIFLTISGTMELPASSILLPFVQWLGRRKATMSCYFLAAIALLGQPFISDDLKWLSITFIMIGKMGSTCAFASVGVYFTELFPTEVRSQGLAAIIAASRGGGILAPYIISALEDTYPWMISVVFGVAALVATVALIPLWETSNIRLPDTLAELEALHKRDDGKKKIVQPAEVTKF